MAEPKTRKEQWQESRVGIMSEKSGELQWSYFKPWLCIQFLIMYFIEDKLIFLSFYIKECNNSLFWKIILCIRCGIGFHTVHKPLFHCISSTLKQPGFFPVWSLFHYSFFAPFGYNSTPFRTLLFSDSKPQAEQGHDMTLIWLGEKFRLFQKKFFLRDAARNSTAFPAFKQARQSRPLLTRKNTLWTVPVYFVLHYLTTFTITYVPIDAIVKLVVKILANLSELLSLVARHRHPLACEAAAQRLGGRPVVAPSSGCLRTLDAGVSWWRAAGDSKTERRPNK